jgi:bifunctional non-homologous end joining protein LigD
MTGDLQTYHRKRNFKRTPEPSSGRPRAAQPRQFVVQKHDARRLHYDFRLEHDGVLKSWAVPKAPSLNPQDRRLAVQTEDHPLDYGNFEGEIPRGQYGAGSVLVWDRGTWTPLADPDRGLADGKLDFELHGDRLNGRWTLVRMAKKDRRKGPENWLLIKRSERSSGSAKKTVVATAGAKRNARQPKARAPAKLRDLRATSGARRAKLPAKPLPQLATAVAQPPAGAGWVHEPKLDGYRLLCRIENGRAALLTRRGNDWTDRFAVLAEAARAVPCRTALLDGEAVIFDSRGLTDFQRLQNAISAADPALVLVVFDLLHLDGWDLHGTPLRARKALLRELLAEAPAALRYGEHADEPGDAFFREACRLGLEGIIAKRADDPYREGRTRSWLKVKCVQRQEFVIVGFTDPGGSRTGFGALLLGTRNRPADPLHYAGKVGTGFNERTLRALRKQLDRLVRKTAPVEKSSLREVGRGVHWVAPKLVAEISFSEWTADGRLRHPTFRGLREDKPAREVVEERPADGPESHSAKRNGKGKSRPAKTPKATPETPPKPAAVKLTHPDKVLFPDDGITKRDLAQYWEAVAEWALPQLACRPLTLFRCPEGHRQQCFYQKHVGAGVPAVVPRVTIKEGEDPYAMVDSVAALLGLVQIGVLELHAWGSRAEHLEQPDIVVFDLDPSEELPWSAVAAAAFTLKARLEALGLRPFARVTGGKGLHVVVPVEPGPSFAAIKRFARAVVNEMVREAPKHFTATMSKSRRTGKIFIDYFRNDRESTAIASYSPRARSGAPIALPLEWDELHADAKKPPRFGLRDVPALVRRRARDPWEDFEAARRSLVD